MYRFEGNVIRHKFSQYFIFYPPFLPNVSREHRLIHEVFLHSKQEFEGPFFCHLADAIYANSIFYQSVISIAHPHIHIIPMNDLV